MTSILDLIDEHLAFHREIDTHHSDVGFLETLKAHVFKLEKQAQTQWQAPDTAPKDGTIILADLGWPWPCAAVWNELNGEWVWANPQLNLVDGKADYYFDNEYERPVELKRWHPLPDLIDEVK